MPYTIDITEDIAAPPERVWRALCSPSEVTRWDTNVIAALDAPPDYPQPGHHVQWRCKSTSELLHDRPQHVEADRRLHSLLEFGRQRMDETYLLTETPAGTRIDLHVELRVRAPFIAGVILRFVDGAAARRDFGTSLANLKRHCEASS
jgi:hypothetical protein